MLASAWFRLLVRHRFAICPSRIPLAIEVFLVSIINSLLKIVQDLTYARRIADTTISKPPIFIIGHWRTGTTYLHELLMMDESLLAPTSLECFVPGHFLISEFLLRMCEGFLPKTRPMDEVKIRWDSPQQDEFALLNLGFGSPSEMMLFPNHRPMGSEFLSMANLTMEQIQAWQAGLLTFIKHVQFHQTHARGCPTAPRRLVLKSPHHTARLNILRQLFPDAKFIHMVRHPFDIFSSSLRLWAVVDTQAFQRANFGRLPNGAPAIEELVLDTMDLLYRDFFAETSTLPSGYFHEVRYEDLVREPIAEMKRIYQRLDLGPFEAVQARLQAHLRTLVGYVPNHKVISEDEKVQVRRRWGWYLEQFNYDPLRA